LGLPFRGEGLDALFAPADLRQGLWAAEIRWHALLPEVLDLYAELEAAADLPGGEAPAPMHRAYRPSPGERGTLEAHEHVLATALRARAAGAAVEVAVPLRVIYSDLRRLAAEQEQEIDRLAERVRSGEATVQRLTAALTAEAPAAVAVAAPPLVGDCDLQQ